MLKEIPTPPSVMDAADSWNSLNMNARVAAIQTFHGNEIPHLGAPEAIDKEKIALFWERGLVEDCPTFAEVVKDSYQHPELYNRRITVAPMTAFRTPDMMGSFHAKLQTSEAEALQGLSRYLDVGEKTAVEVGNEEIRQLVGSLKEDLGYISERGFDYATDVIAAAWIEYTKGGSDHVLNIWDPSETQQSIKSNNFVLETVMAKIEEQLKDDPETGSRILVGSDKWKDTPNAKLIVLEDWSLSGSQTQGYLNIAARKAKNEGLEDLAEKIELHLLVAGSKHTLMGNHNVPVRAVHQARGNFLHDASVTGFHSSTDYGFGSSLDKISSMLTAAGVVEPLPQLSKIDRHYRSDRALANLLLLEHPDFEAENQILVLQTKEQKRTSREADEIRDEIQNLQVGSPEREVAKAKLKEVTKHLVAQNVSLGRAFQARLDQHGALIRKSIS